MYAAGMIMTPIGLGMVLVGWLFFRKPGVGLWTFAPVWRANQYLEPPGAALWIAGCVVGFVGLVLVWMYGLP